MSFVTAIFLWAGLAVGIPIVIALWSRQRYKKEKFGAFFLLRKVAESTRRKIQLLQLLKLLNRILMICLLVLIFAEPLHQVLRLSEASEGFAIILDNSRNMQAIVGEETLVQLELEALKKSLKTIPPHAKGLVLLANEDCKVLTYKNISQTAAAEEWLDWLDLKKIPFLNKSITANAISQCVQRADATFAGKKILKVLISNFPESIDESILKTLDFHIVQLPSPEFKDPPPLNVVQKLNQSTVSLEFNWDQPRESFVIYKDGQTEDLGKIDQKIELSSNRSSWLWIRGGERFDPWVGSEIIPLKTFDSKTITVWANKETEGFLSLFTALKSHPSIQVVRQIGGAPRGSYVIIYGAFSQSIPSSIERVWMFSSSDLNPDFPVRDQKQWAASVSSEDVRKSFEIETPDGRIFIKKYALYDLDRLKVVDSFRDGAPSLLERETPTQRIWISPFDLEDLTTDLTLEPTFIPYLYRHLDRWLERINVSSSSQVLPSLWLMPGSSEVNGDAAQQRAWPGIYGDPSTAIVQNPIPLAHRYYPSIEVNFSKSEVRAENESMRAQFYPWLMLSIFIELFLCFASAKWALMSLLILLTPQFNLSAEPITKREIPIACFSSMDADRFKALTQFVQEVGGLSNLDFATPEKLNKVQDVWKYSLIFGSSDKALPEFTNSERDILRDYLDRGGLIVFDDPLALKDSSFYESVKREMKMILAGRDFEVVPRDDVLFRTFYLLQEVSGRKLSSASIEGIKLDDRWVVIYSFNDLLGAILRRSAGDYALSVSPYGVMQRRLSKRLLLNIMMYGVTTDYKNDAIHLPHILKRRVK